MLKQMLRWIGLCVAVVGAGIVACGSDAYGPAGTGGTPAVNEVWMQNMAFNPSTRTVTVGTKVTFINKDTLPHTVTSSSVPSGAATFNSGNLAANGTIQITFNVAGTYQYFCSIHGTATTGMRGTVVVN